ncbi:MAG: CRISPR-associated endonuclease Cas2 [Anaerolineaceae bacterium]|nr:CRISPR-associated endonuclease Cas2 [Anaerolineaceae bacterium]
MMIIITYDVNTETEKGKTRLRKVAKACQNYGVRVQNSVFECLIDPDQWVKLKAKLESIIDPQLDSLRYYFLGKNWKKQVEHVGAKPSIDLSGVLIA